MVADRSPPRTGVPWIAAGAVAGVALGAALRGLSAPWYYLSFGLGLAAAVIVLLLGVFTIARVLARVASGGWARARTPAFAGAALGVCLVAGYLVTPPAWGSFLRSPGTGTAGTAQNRTAYWSGDLECTWTQGEANVRSVVGFAVQLSDALIQELDLEPGEASQKVVAVSLPAKLAGEAGIGIGFDRENYGGRGLNLSLVAVSRAGASGEAISRTGLLALSWTCAAGP
jgi:hypothetical protein